MKLESNNYNVLRKNGLFRDKTNEEIDKTVAILNGKIKSYEKNEFVHRDYELFPFFGLVLSGVVSACTDDIEGNQIIITQLTEGKTFGESLCFLKTKNSPVYVYVIENCKILWLSLDNLYDGDCDKFKIDLQRRFTKIIAKRPLEMNQRIQVLSKIKLRDRITTYLSGLSAESGKNIVTIPLNREEMASYIGANRTALSRELSAMKKEGIIDYYKNTFHILKEKDTI